LKKWHVNFDARMTQVDILLVWVRIPRLPLVLWSEDVFAEIGNSLGSYYEVDLSFQDTGYFGMARILVGLETSKGLAEELVI
jgi:hypothetical protein